MTTESKRTYYLLKSGIAFLDEDGDRVKDYGCAVIFNFEYEAHTFLEENPDIADKRPRIEPHEFSDKQMTSFMRMYREHLQLKKR
jgi:hypothetical protein